MLLWNDDKGYWLKLTLNVNAKWYKTEWTIITVHKAGV